MSEVDKTASEASRISVLETEVEALKQENQRTTSALRSFSESVERMVGLIGNMINSTRNQNITTMEAFVATLAVIELVVAAAPGDERVSAQLRSLKEAFGRGAEKFKSGRVVAVQDGAENGGS